MTIKVLPPEVAAQIAAGEVVERPASVVKELVENAIDAGASQIIVETRAGGIEQLRVTDDGQGIPADEVELAFHHHATSKLQVAGQLDSITTLGFRGEALPSVAAVSRLTIVTRTRQVERGHRVESQWGKQVRAGVDGCPPGTSVAVSDLFGNLPARRKFLRSISSESARVQEVVSRYALAYPEIRFQLVVDGRVAFTTTGSGKSGDALLVVLGTELASGMLEVQGQDRDAGYRVHGFVSSPKLNRANRSHMTFFVNRRWIQSRLLSFALEEAYHSLLPEKRYPLAVLNLAVDYGEVDVNAHPAKREVRFRNERKVFSTLQRAVRAALMAFSPVPELQLPVGNTAPTKPLGVAGPSFPPTEVFGGWREIPLDPPSERGGREVVPSRRGRI